jgi:hypothetical protein
MLSVSSVYFPDFISFEYCFSYYFVNFFLLVTIGGTIVVIRLYYMIAVAPNSLIHHAGLVCLISIPVFFSIQMQYGFVCYCVSVLTCSWGDACFYWCILWDHPVPDCAAVRGSYWHGCTTQRNGMQCVIRHTLHVHVMMSWMCADLIT